MQAGQMVAAVYRRTGYAQDDGLVTPDRVLEGINEGLQNIASERDWPWLMTSATFSSVAGTATYAPPADWAKTVRLIDAFGEPLERWDAAQLEDLFGLDQGEPARFAVNDEVLVLRPIPSAVRVYTHEYVRFEKTLVADTETPYLPARFHAAAVVLGEAAAHETGRNTDRAEAAMKRYEQWRSRMLDDSRRTRGPQRARVRDGSAF